MVLINLNIQLPHTALILHGKLLIRKYIHPVLEMLQPGLVVATGHYRNGVLLTPVTAERVSEILDHNLPITRI